MLQLPTARPALVGDERWFLVHTLPKKERTAELHLRAQGFRIFLPQCQKTIRHARQLRTVLSPVFPRYLFVILNLERDRWLSVRSTVGVAGLFMQNNRPAPVPLGVVESLIQRSDSGVMRLDVGLIKGQKVRVLSGPFADFVGSLEHLGHAGRTRVLLNVMGSTVPVTMERTALAPAA